MARFITMADININAFMARFHALERDLALFSGMADGEPWWDSVRYEVCYFLYDCLACLEHSLVYRPVAPSRRLGRWRRELERQLLLLDCGMRPRDLLLIRAARATVAGKRYDAVLDPAAALVSEPARTIDTMPRRYHLPHCPPDAVGIVPANLEQVLAQLLSAFAIDQRHLKPLVRRVHRLRAEHHTAKRGYDVLLDRARPRAILMVQNGLEKALYQVAAKRQLPVLEMQHGLIGFGHPAYSYPRDIDLSGQTGFPSHFLTFSSFWSRGINYPAGEHVAIGTDHFAAGIAPVATAIGAIMVIAADIYHADLLSQTRRLAQHLPHRRIIYKLHPNQSAAEPAITAALADLPNVTVGAAATPAVQMMNEVTHLVAIQSTVVYEALQAGRLISLLPWYDYHLHTDIFTDPAVAVPDDDEQLAASLQRPAGPRQGPVYFEPLAADRIRSVVTQAMARA